MSELQGKKLSIPTDWQLLVIYMEALNTPCLLPLMRLKEVSVLDSSGVCSITQLIPDTSPYCYYRRTNTEMDDLY